MYRMGWDYNLSALPYSPVWRAARRMFHQHFHPGVVNIYRPVQLQPTREFLLGLLTSPSQSRKHIRQLVTSAIFSAVYGKKITGPEDEYVTIAQKAAVGGGLAHVPGKYWVEFMPFLRHIPSWIPGASFQKVAEEYRPWVLLTKERGYNEAKEANVSSRGA